MYLRLLDIPRMLQVMCSLMFNQQSGLGQLPLTAGVWTVRQVIPQLCLCFTRCPVDPKRRCPRAFRGFFFLLTGVGFAFCWMFQPPISCFTDGSTVNVFCSYTVQALQKCLRADPKGEKKKSKVQRKRTSKACGRRQQ